MEKALDFLIDMLEKSIHGSDFVDVAYGIVEEIAERDDAIEAIQPILMIIERNPNTDFGTPGPLVHFIEKFYKRGYEEKLVDSLRRCPTKHTIWMLNRIINGSQGDSKKYYIDTLEDIIKSYNIDDEILSLANHFRTLYHNK